ncbi:MAG: bifunctional folylpolyglutamate synthase/dihydrofolate synthase [Candidatus Marinimicrobia bacterium]|nr:bifunctional folylpolyglutamate synthase/dihydrofolate synthase [Candidatus Neomarinimicrobiota bacterium]|tara:strand:- start:2508 stop:3737 length:1230 start_codon:yes stop_codon:yes gene_type:complete
MSTISNYKMTSKEYLLSIESSTIKLGLDRTIELMDACGNPQNDLPVIQISGTNGKGSTAAMMAKILDCAGYKVGLSTSPHLVEVNERIRINGEPISDASIEEFIQCYKPDIERISASFFESVTAMGFWYFKKNNVDIAIMETGLGGRLDSVTICNPILTVITSISLDHTEILGDTIEKIAFEKAGIMKAGVPCVTAHQHKNATSVLQEQAANVDCKLIHTNENILHNTSPSLMGKYQFENACLAATSLQFLNGFNISDENIKLGIEQTTWYGRNEIIQQEPTIIFDVGHNESGIQGFLDYYNSMDNSGISVLILSLQRRKIILGIIPQLFKSFDFIICCETDNIRTMTIDEISNQMGKSEKILYIKSPIDAINKGLTLLKKSDDTMAIVGTHHFGEPISTIFNKSFNTL